MKTSGQTERQENNSRISETGFRLYAETMQDNPGCQGFVAGNRAAGVPETGKTTKSRKSMKSKLKLKRRLILELAYNRKIWYTDSRTRKGESGDGRCRVFRDAAEAP